MITLNLINKSCGDIDYKIINFPDGEPHIVLSEFDRKQEVAVICRITNPNELFVLMQVGNILNRQGVEFHLTIAYLMSMRMDRVISFNEAFSLEIVANCINSIHPLSVKIVEPHSERAIRLISRSRAVSAILIDYISCENICFPDKGAEERYKNERLCKHILYCRKERDVLTGKLSGFKIENPEVYQGGNVTVIDDLCDGGRTFVGIAKELRKLAPDIQIGIFVTHVVNSMGIKMLSDNYDQVIFTDSYYDWNIGALPQNVTCLRIFESPHKDLKLYEDLINPLIAN